MDDLDIIDPANQAEFFAPSTTGALDLLLAQYAAMRGKIERVADVMASTDLDGALHYFGQYAESQDTRMSSSTVERMFDRAGAIAYLNAGYWSKAMQMTDVLDVMPQKRRDEWHEQIRYPLGKKRDRWDTNWLVEPIPEFDAENVRSTISGLLAQRETFFAERVDGIFRALSKTHLTNAPEGFSKRMILANVVDGFGYVGHGRAGVINDLRCVIARFMGRDEPGYDATGPVIRYAREHRGEWITIDGGALRLRCYAVGTAHLEVHPDIAWRLNCVLARLYPTAIPTEFRERPKRKLKEFRMMSRPLPFAVLSRLSTLDVAQDLNPDRHSMRSNTFIRVPGCYDIKATTDEGVAGEVARVLQSLGGTPAGTRPNRWAFDYNPLEVVKEVVASGVLPDQRAHQFYPTPAWLGLLLVSAARINDAHTVLEPSAGIGGLADLLPNKAAATCIEISPVHCGVLEAKGYFVRQGDFISIAEDYRMTFDRVVMNPPFSEGRWQAHLQHAAGLLNPHGRLAAILPSSARTKAAELLPGFDVQCHSQHDNAFPGASVSVVLITATRNNS